MPLSSGSNSPGRLETFDPEDEGMKAIEPFKPLGVAHPVTQLHNPEDLTLQNSYLSLTPFSICFQ
jgi:hypothetical protein